MVGKLLGKLSVKKNMLIGTLSIAPGGSGTMQEKVVSPTVTEQVVTPDAGYDGLSAVTVEAAPLQDKTVSPSASQQVVTPGLGYYGLSQVVVEAILNQTKRVSPRLAQQVVEPDDGFDGLESVTVGSGLSGINSNNFFISVVRDDERPIATSWDYVVLYTELGQQFRKFDLIHNQNVSVKSRPTEQTINVPVGYTGHGTITVEKLSLQDKTVSPETTQQTVSADEGYDGLAQVVVEAIPNDYGRISYNGSYLKVY